MSSPAPLRQLPQLQKYELLAELGHGGMATVYRARDLRLDREVAIKVIHKHLRESPEVGRRFAVEARAVAKLRHPNIVEVYDVSGEEEPEKYLVVELLGGVTLRKILSERAPLPVEVAAGIGLEIGGALAHAHSAGVVHRDVKPENVLIEVPPDSESDVRVKLTDFGIAKILDSQGVTSTGQVLGSPAHMAPEQIEGGDVDGRADVFALGVLLYECMAGHLPFQGNNPAQVLRRVLEGSYTPADRVNPLVGGRWARILSLALARQAADRYPSIEAFLQAMSGELSSCGITDHRQEIRSYFAESKQYCERLPARLVPVLVKRGEAARKAGDIVGAAADFNRALAHAPQDAELPRLMLRLRRGTAWRRMLKLSALGAALLVGIGLAAYGALRVRAPGRPVTTAPSDPSAMASATAGGEQSRQETLSASVGLPVMGAVSAASTTQAGIAPAHSRPTATSAHSSELSSASRDRKTAKDPSVTRFRDVRFLVNPQGARVSIDDGPSEDLSFGKIRHLAVGAHVFRAHVPESSCCKPLTREYEIRQDEGAEEPQEVRLALAFNDASFSVLEAPPDAVLRCPLLRIVGPAGRVHSVQMQSLDLDVSCDLESPATQRFTTSVRLRAGALTPVPWPGH